MLKDAGKNNILDLKPYLLMKCDILDYPSCSIDQLTGVLAYVGNATGISEADKQSIIELKKLVAEKKQKLTPKPADGS